MTNNTSSLCGRDKKKRKVKTIILIIATVATMFLLSYLMDKGYCEIVEVFKKFNK